MSNRIEAPMIAPNNGGGNFTLRKNLIIPDEGPRQMLLIGIIDIGTHIEKHGKAAGEEKRKMIVTFEKPDLKQLVYEEDTVPRTWQRSDEMGYSMYKNAKLFKIAKAIVGTKYSDDQLEKGINLFELLGGRCYVTIVHKPNPNDADNPYVNFEGFSRVGNDPEPPNFVPSGDRYAFYIDDDGKNFMTDNFAELPGWVRKKIMESNEGKEHIAKGGKFAEPLKEEDKPQQNQSAPPPPAATQTGNDKILTFKDRDFKFTDISGANFTYEQYIGNGWTNAQLSKMGYLVEIPRIAQPTPPPAPLAAEVQAPPPPAQQTPPPTETNAAYNPFDGDDDDDLPF